MSPQLDRAFAEASKLPATDQDALAALILDEIEDDRRWAESFARNPGKLVALAARAVEQVKNGQCQTAGFDEL